jgi:hypothetical protein
MGLERRVLAVVALLALSGPAAAEDGASETAEANTAGSTPAALSPAPQKGSGASGTTEGAFGSDGSEDSDEEPLAAGLAKPRAPAKGDPAAPREPGRAGMHDFLQQEIQELRQQAHLKFKVWKQEQRLAWQEQKEQLREDYRAEVREIHIWWMGQVDLLKARCGEASTTDASNGTGADRGACGKERAALNQEARERLQQAKDDARERKAALDLHFRESLREMLQDIVDDLKDAVQDRMLDLQARMAIDGAARIGVRIGHDRDRDMPPHHVVHDGAQCTPEGVCTPPPACEGRIGQTPECTPPEECKPIGDGTWQCPPPPMGSQPHCASMDCKPALVCDAHLGKEAMARCHANLPRPAMPAPCREEAGRFVCAAHLEVAPRCTEDGLCKPPPECMDRTSGASDRAMCQPPAMCEATHDGMWKCSADSAPLAEFLKYIRSRASASASAEGGSSQ